jgi:hypothetical protein
MLEIRRERITGSKPQLNVVSKKAKVFALKYINSSLSIC